jgi:hypothetical protein
MGTMLPATGAGGLGFVPTQIAGLTFWLRADMGTWQDQGGSVTPAAADGDPVGRWVDQSGNAADVTGYNSTTQRGTLKLSQVNGKPVIRFAAASSQGMQTFGNGGTSPPQTTTTATLFAVVKHADTANGKWYLNGAAGSNGYGLAKFGNARSFLIEGVAAQNDGTVPTTAFELWSATTDGSTNNMWVNGSQVLTNVNNAVIAPTANLYVNESGNYCNCDIAELLLYNSALSTAQRQQVESYLNGKYALY